MLLYAQQPVAQSQVSRHLHKQDEVRHVAPSALPLATASVASTTTPIRQGRRIAIVGASGNIGTATLRVLLSHGIHTITVLVRPESTSAFHPSVTVLRGSLTDSNFLISSLRGIDVLVIQLPIMGTDHLHEPLYRAAAVAGVPWILPTEFGSDPEAKPIHALFPFLSQKTKRRKLIEDLGVSWTAVVTNPWYDYCLARGAGWGIDVTKRTATLWDGGEYKMSTTTLSRAGQATAELLALPEDQLSRFKNDIYRVASFRISQQDVLKSIMRVTSTTARDWKISAPDAAVADREFERRLAATRCGLKMDYEAFTSRFMLTHLRPGTGGDFEGKVVEDMGRLGHKAEELDEVTRMVIGEMFKSTGGVQG